MIFHIGQGKVDIEFLKFTNLYPVYLIIFIVIFSVSPLFDFTDFKFSWVRKSFISTQTKTTLPHVNCSKYIQRHKNDNKFTSSSTRYYTITRWTLALKFEYLYVLSFDQVDRQLLWKLKNIYSYNHISICIWHIFFNWICLIFLLKYFFKYIRDA